MISKEEFYSNRMDEGMAPYEFRGSIPYKYYGKLLDIADKNHIITFDINDVLTFVIKNFPSKFDEK